MSCDDVNFGHARRLRGAVAGLLVVAGAMRCAFAGTLASSASSASSSSSSEEACTAKEQSRVTTQPTAPPSEIWFGDLDRPLPPELAAGAGAAMVISDTVGLTANIGMLSLLRWALGQPGAEGALPASVREDRAPRVVFLAAGDGLAESRVFIGRGMGVLAAVADANREWRAAGGENRAASWRRLDVVASASFVGPEERATTRLQLRRRIDGIAFEAGSEVALSPGELVGRRLIGTGGVIDWMRVLEYLRRRQPGAAGAELRPAYRFTIVGAAAEGDRVVALEREVPVMGSVDPAALRDAARLGGRYLAGALDAGGRFTYRYRADTGTVRAGYNIVRHAGAVYSLIELYEATKDAQTLAAAERALGYLLRQIQPAGPAKPATRGEPPNPEREHKPIGTVEQSNPEKTRDAGGGEAERACLVEDGEVKLGGNALAVVALAKYAAVTGRREHVGTAIALGEWILGAQAENGRFTIHQETYPAGEPVSGFVSEYYPGEAVLALVRLQALAPGRGSRDWLDAGERGARWLITNRDGDLPDDKLPHDHWLLYALNELYRLRPEPILLAHARRLARVIIASQHRAPAVPEWRGGYYEPPRTTPTATRSEGLAAAYALVRDFGGPGDPGAEGDSEAERILDALRLGIGFQLRTQFVPATAIYLPEPGRALGGFHNTLDDSEIRIDYVQHNISSLLALARILGAAPPSPTRASGLSGG
jgi:hypothetical protein